METENVIENAQNKFFKKNCDLQRLMIYLKMVAGLN